MSDWLERTELQFGKEGLNLLKKAKVCLVGLGGVGGYAAEMIARAGIGQMIIVDADTIHKSNINRQIIALQSTVGQDKTSLFQKRLLDINPQLQLTVFKDFLDYTFIEEKLAKHLDNNTYLIDAIDTIQPKIDLIQYCLNNKIKIISSMGGGGKTNPEKLQITDISKTHNCRLAGTVRRRLKPLGIRKGLKVLFSPEQVSGDKVKKVEGERNKKTTVGTISYFPPIMGCYLASWVIRKIIGEL